MILPVEYSYVPSSDPNADTEMSAPTILVVDPDPAMRKALSILLKLQYMVLSASSVEEAVGLLDEIGADLVILEHQLPETSGFEALMEIREKSSRVPVLLLTAHGDDRVFEQAMQLGADECMHKPFNLDDVLGSLDRLLAVPRG